MGCGLKRDIVSSFVFSELQISAVIPRPSENLQDYRLTYYHGESEARKCNCRVGDSEGKELYSLLREPNLKTSSDMHKSHLWSRDPWLANVASGHEDGFEKCVRFPWGYSENLWGIKLVKDWTSTILAGWGYPTAFLGT